MDNDNHGATEQQMNTQHAYEGAMPRQLAWQYENIFNDFMTRAAAGTPERGNLLQRFGQGHANRGHTQLAEKWAEFMLLKFIDKADEMVADDIDFARAVRDLADYSGHYLSGTSANRLLLNAARKHATALN